MTLGNGALMESADIDGVEVTKTTAPRKRRVPCPDDLEFLVPLRRMCEVLDLPVKSMRREAMEGRIPSARIGTRLLCHVPTVKKHLQRRAMGGERNAAT